MFLQGIEALRPGYELDETAAYQFKETCRMQVENYHDIIENGWLQWYNCYLCTILHPPMTSGQVTGQRWMLVGMNAGAAILKPLLADNDSVSRGKIVLGTVKGDLHDIGKSLVKMMMEGKGIFVLIWALMLPRSSMLRRQTRTPQSRMPDSKKQNTVPCAEGALRGE